MNKITLTTTRRDGHSQSRTMRKFVPNDPRCGYISPACDELGDIIGHEAVASGEGHFRVRTRGPWGIIHKLEGLAVEKTSDGVIIHGMRSLFDLRESGYQMEGRVSIDGKKLRAFTSSQMFTVNGKLVDVAILYVCRQKHGPVA